MDVGVAAGAVAAGVTAAGARVRTTRRGCENNKRQGGSRTSSLSPC